MFFVYKKVTLGGTETLILRVARELKKIEPCAVICSSISQEAKSLFGESDVNIIRLQNWNEKNLTNIIKSQKAMFFNPADFILVNCYLQSDGIDSNCFLYVVHYGCVTIQSNSLKCLNRWINKDAKRIFEVLEDSGRIIFMDDMCANYYRNFYAIDRNKILKIVHLPLTEPKIVHKVVRNNMNINILAVARADFPFKGYLLGLIKTLQKSFFSVKVNLTIISYGDGFPQLKALSEEKVDNESVSINVVGKIDYDKLIFFYQNADLYIGMGTTIIEAASNMCVSIPVLPYTYEIVTDKYFYEMPNCIALEEYGHTSVIELINHYIDASDEEKFEMKQRSYEAFRNNYSMDSYLKTISNLRFEHRRIDISLLTKSLLKIRMVN